MWLLISFSIFQTHPPHLPHKVYEMTCHSCGTVGRQPPGSMSASYEGSHPSELHLFSSHYLPATGTMREGTPPGTTPGLCQTLECASWLSFLRFCIELGLLGPPRAGHSLGVTAKEEPGAESVRAPHLQGMGTSTPWSALWADNGQGLR